MSTQQDLLIVLRAVIALRSTQKALDRAKSQDERVRLATALVQMEEQLDLALEALADQLREQVANDD